MAAASGAPARCGGAGVCGALRILSPTRDAELSQFPGLSVRPRREHTFEQAKRSNVDKNSLQLLLSQGLSVERIAKRFGKDPSTVSYWMKKHGLTSPYKEKHAAKGAIDRDELTALVRAGASIDIIGRTLGRSDATVRHWLAKYGLETQSSAQRRAGRAARDAGELILKRECRHHGLTDFWLEGRGAYRCMRCRQEAVGRRRRRVKEILVREAGGACVICGYDKWMGALEFHHVNPREKAFCLGSAGVTRALDRVREEARKCVLLCSNCHAEVEGGVRTLPIPTPV
jgi:transposase